MTSSTGFPLDAGDKASFDLISDGAHQLYAVVASGTQDVNVLRIGV